MYNQNHQEFLDIDKDPPYEFIIKATECKVVSVILLICWKNFYYLDENLRTFYYLWSLII